MFLRIATLLLHLYHRHPRHRHHPSHRHHHHLYHHRLSHCHQCSNALLFSYSISFTVIIIIIIIIIDLPMHCFSLLHFVMLACHYCHHKCCQRHHQFCHNLKAGIANKISSLNMTCVTLNKLQKLEDALVEQMLTSAKHAEL